MSSLSRGFMTCKNLIFFFFSSGQVCGRCGWICTATTIGISSRSPPGSLSLFSLHPDSRERDLSLHSRVMFSKDTRITRHAKLWLEEGNVILAAHPSKDSEDIENYIPDTQETVLFRLHKWVLARHSEVFKDMFGAGDASLDEKFEGLPVVKMHDASGYLELLLDALFNAS